ncbi:MAG TPA: hypothetical protein VE869_00310 [Gemmatimonas sp.]|nr:hypothetical protein [Gemmatimonas sp.]
MIVVRLCDAGSLAGVAMALMMAGACGAPRERTATDSGALGNGASAMSTPSASAPAPAPAPAPPNAVPDPTRENDAGESLDTARGIVLRTGAEPMTALVLTRASSAEHLTLRGAAMPSLGAVEGIEVVVRGRLTAVTGADGPTRRPAGRRAGTPVFDVISFTVRAAEGREAVDGIVMRDTQGFALRLNDGSLRRAPHMPSALQSELGRRVFLVGSLDQPPVAYGIIAPRP